MGTFCSPSVPFHGARLVLLLLAQVGRRAEVVPKLLDKIGAVDDLAGDALRQV